MQCENCGCNKYDGYCVNCDEEVFIVDQYIELGMKLPSNGTNFMQKYNTPMGMMNQLNNYIIDNERYPISELNKEIL